MSSTLIASLFALLFIPSPSSSFRPFYSFKGMAGNIIPAIATTNAIVAGVQVLQAFRILKGQTLVSSLPSDLSDDAT